MAMICINGVRECDGCGACFEPTLPAFDCDDFSDAPEEIKAKILENDARLQERGR